MQNDRPTTTRERLWALMPVAVLAIGLTAIGCMLMQRIALLDQGIALLDRTIAQLDRDEARHAR